MKKQILAIRLWFNNPELTRNVWQELSVQQVVVLPIVLGMIVFLLANTVGGDNTARFLMMAGFAVYCFYTVLWGMRLAANSLKQEFLEETWDAQRMSGMSPNKLLWGKLLGSTAGVWYGAGIAFIIFICGWSGADISLGWLLRTLAGMVMLALCLHAISMLFCLARLKKERGKAYKASGGGIFITIFLFLLISNFVFGLQTMASGRIFIQNDSMQWFGFHIGIYDFGLLGLLLITMWSIFGVRQLIRSECLYRNTPYGWLFFLIFWLIFFAGFIQEIFVRSHDDSSWLTGLSVYLMVAIALISATIYIQLFLSRHDTFFWLHFIRAYQQKNKCRFKALFPNWLTSYAVTWILSLILVVVLVKIQIPSGGFGGLSVMSVLIAVVAGMLFILRDVLIVIWLNLHPKAKRADIAGFVYIFLLYVVVPAFFAGIIPNSSLLFFPIVGVFGSTTTSWQALFILSPILQVALMFALIVSRWRAHWIRY